MRASFFQTYSDRLDLLAYWAHDKLFFKFLDLFDVNILSLHNVSQRVANYVRSAPEYGRFWVVENVDVTYTACIKRLIDLLKDAAIDRVFFCQDDTFSNELMADHIGQLDKIIDAFPLLCLSHSLDWMQMRKKWDVRGKVIMLTSGDISVFGTDTFDFRDCLFWAMDDTSYVASRAMVSHVYDEAYLATGSVWEAEVYLRDRFSKERLPRYVTNVSFFRNYNILGPNKHEGELGALGLKLGFQAQVTS